MEYSKGVKVLQFIAGGTGVIIGMGMAFAPITFQSSADIVLGDNISLLSETRASGALLLVGSIIVLMSVYKSKWRYVGLVLTALMYLGYGSGRAVSLMLDGMPHQSLLMALMLELIIGGLALLSLRRSN